MPLAKNTFFVENARTHRYSDPRDIPGQSVPESSGYANYTGYSDPIVYPGLPKQPDSGNRQRSFPVMEVARKPVPDTGEFLYRRIVLLKN